MLIVGAHERQKLQNVPSATNLYRTATGAARQGDAQPQQRRLLVEQLAAEGGSEVLQLLQLLQQLYLLRLQAALACPHCAHCVVVGLPVGCVSGILSNSTNVIM